MKGDSNQIKSNIFQKNTETDYKEPYIKMTNDIFALTTKTERIAVSESAFGMVSMVLGFSKMFAIQGRLLIVW